MHKGITSPFGDKLRGVHSELNSKLGGPIYTLKQVTGKVKRLKTSYFDFKTLLGNTICTGFGWDPTTNTVSGPEHEWEKLKSDYGPDKYFCFKKNPPIHYDLLSSIFDGTYATGQFGFASTQDVPESDTEEPELDLNSPPATIDMTEGANDHGNNSKGKGKRRSTSKDSGRSSKRSSKQDEFFEKMEAGWTKRCESYDKHMEKFTSSSSAHAATSHTRVVKSTVEQAFDIINDLMTELDLPDEKYYRALTFATHSNQALMIVKMDPERRRRWILTNI